MRAEYGKTKGDTGFIIQQTLDERTEKTLYSAPEDLLKLDEIRREINMKQKPIQQKVLTLNSEYYNPKNISFWDGKERVGNLSWESGKFVFEGKAEESGKKFWEWLVNYANDQLFQARKEGAIDMLEKVFKALVREEGHPIDKEFPLEEWEQIYLSEVNDVLYRLKHEMEEK